MSAKLVINSKTIDLKPGEVVALTLQVNDVGSVDDRQSTFTNTFSVPKANQNRSKLEFADQLPSSTRLPYRKLPAIYYQNGVQVLKNGFAQIKESSEDFSIVLFDGNISFFDLITNLKLSDLDFSDLDHVWDLATVFGMISNTEGIIYPIVDYGNAPLTFTVGTRNVDVRYLQPWIFVHTIIEKIFEGTGYTLLGKFPSSDLYLNLIASLPTMNFDESYLIAKAESTADTPPIAVSPLILLFDQIDSDPLAAIDPPGNFVTTTETKFVAYLAGTYDFKAVLPWVTNSNPNPAFIELNNTAGGVIQYRQVDGNSSGTETVIAKGLVLAEGDEVYVTIRHSTLGGSIKVLAGATFESTTVVNVKAEYGKLFSISNNLPDISQKDFIKAIMQMFCITPITNTVNKTVTFCQFGEVVTNIYKFRDWTAKVHRGSEARVVFQQDGYSRTNNLKYKADETVDDGLGDGSFTIDNENLDFRRDLLTLPFAASKMTVKFDGVDVPEYLRYDAGTSAWSDGSPRILILEKQTPVGLEFTYIDGGGGIPNLYEENLCYFALDGKTYNLKFSDNLLSVHYADFISMLQSFKKITLPMKLTAVDVETWLKNSDNEDDLIPVYLKMYGAFFYVNKINQWIDDATICDVELVRIGEQAVTTTAIDLIPLLNENGTPLLSEKGLLLYAEDAFS